MRFTGDPVVGRGVSERRFEVQVEDRTVPGLVWTSEDATGTRPLVLLGHGGSQEKRSPNILSLARRLVRHLGYAAAAIDAPFHGERAEEGVTLASLQRHDPERLRSAFVGAREEWRQTLTELKQTDSIGDGPTGYWGLSMGTVLGVPYVASEPRIDAAVLGLMGLSSDARGEASRAIDIPVLFLFQWDDELVKRADGLALFDTLGTKNKTMHINPGLHSAVPVAEIEASERHFEKYLGAKIESVTA
jgi:dienelactone hydrolase